MYAYTWRQKYYYVFNMRVILHIKWLTHAGISMCIYVE